MPAIPVRKQQAMAMLVAPHGIARSARQYAEQPAAEQHAEQPAAEQHAEQPAAAQQRSLQPPLDACSLPAACLVPSCSLSCGEGRQTMA
jgi:hypothetical protein